MVDAEGLVPETTIIAKYGANAFITFAVSEYPKFSTSESINSTL